MYIYSILYGKLDEVARLRYSSSVFMGICTILFLIYKIISWKMFILISLLKILWEKEIKYFFIKINIVIIKE